MSNYKDYPCWDCSYYNNCGKEHVKLSYKFIGLVSVKHIESHGFDKKSSFRNVK